MIKNHFQSVLSSASQLKTNSSPKTQSNQDSQSTETKTKDVEFASYATFPVVTAHNSFSLLYGKFRAISSSIKVLIEQLEERKSKYAECRQVGFIAAS